MATLVPAVIPQSYTHLRTTLEHVVSFTNEVQIDIVDGVFVPFISWPYVETEQVSAVQQLFQGLTVEIDLMITNPETVITEYLDIGVHAVVVHLESTECFGDIVALRRARNFKLGASISSDTDLAVLLSCIPEVDYVQLMGIRNIGQQGQPFDTTVLERIRTIKEQFPDTRISIDGSVNSQTIDLLCRAGADRLVSGSAILGALNPKEAYTALLSQVHSK